SRVDLNTHAVHTVLDHGVEAFSQLGLADIVLVLADSDGLGVDLDQLCQRVLQSATNGHGTADGHVQVGKLPGGISGGGVDGRAGFIDDDFLKLELWMALDQVTYQFVRLPGGRAVADGNQFDVVLGGP